MKISLSQISFCGKPQNYAVIDKYLSRSAQPQKEDFKWLKEQGVTDVFNFRTMFITELNFDEKTVVEEQGMKYHNIPSYTRHPNENNIENFLQIIDKIKSEGGKAHIHCKAGADRTGMYAFIYKMLNNLGNLASNKAEWLRFGHHDKIYPDLIPWTEKFVSEMMKHKL